MAEGQEMGVGIRTVAGTVFYYADRHGAEGECVADFGGDEVDGDEGRRPGLGTAGR